MFRIAGLVAVWVVSGFGGLYASGRFHRRMYPEDIDPIFIDREMTVAVLIAVWFVLGMVGTVLFALLDRHLRRKRARSGNQ